MLNGSQARDRVVVAFDALTGGGVSRCALDRGGRLLQWVQGGSGTPVVLEAGAMSPVAGFAAVFKGLVSEHRVIAYDRASYGASDPAPLSLDGQVDDLIAVLEETGPSVVVGHSWGGLLAQFATWTRPDLVTGLVLLDPSHETFWTDAPPEASADRTRPAADDPRTEDVLAFGHDLAADVARSVGADQHLTQLLTDACLSYLETDAQLFTYLDELPMILDHVDDLTARRRQAVWPEIPVVLLTATKGRPPEFTPQVIAVQEQLATECDGRHQVVPDSGHYMHIDRPDLVIACVEEVAG
ncbi:alpha/beta fold hydrolase [Kribbella sp. VKM Ac-2566]|uniref:alpha/beta fold hydrolase n=1 Tax=Kribbella sp. VKM Ac-2566 TaxID=2512218 RepID=UPI001063FF6B|nr:alpha/beta hydrolase [Kribbella sp. VKM Ac-2566]TDX03299.1 pimeloyl-ACP methyl ester carboxylesterase [Kribbella sp. VKM Ac-2566]